MTNSKSSFFAKLLFPQRCRFCNTVIDIREETCKNCEENKNEITGEICMLCGFKAEDCVCKKHKNYYNAVAAPYYYDGTAEKAIYNLKFNGIKSVADGLSHDMANCFSRYFENYSFEYITYVPMTEKSMKLRTFNQAQLLAEKVSDITGIPCIKILEKTVETKTQHFLKENERTGNLLGVFEINENEIEKIQNARILLIDDIKTTGSTLNECAKTLLIGGAAEVFCLTAAIVRKK